MIQIPITTCRTFRAAIILLLATVVVRPAHAAPIVQLSAISSPTVQTLISLGSDGVDVGPYHLFDFTYSGTAVPAAWQVGVQPIAETPVAGDAFDVGIRLLCPWFATSSQIISNSISYKLELLDPTQPLDQISLFSDGTAPVPGAGTYAGSSLTAWTAAATVVGRTLRTLDNGQTSSNDSDTVSFTPQTEPLTIIESVLVASGSANGVATANVIENTFASVPEPPRTAWAPAIAGIIVVMLTRRRNRRRARARLRWELENGLGAAVG
jgi:hypothetical protein